MEGESDPMYEFELANDKGDPGRPVCLRLTVAEFQELRRSNPKRFARLFAANSEAYDMRRQVEGTL